MGQQVSVQELLAQHDALVLAAGAGRPRDLPVDGRQFKGVHLAVPYLTTNTKSLLDTGAPPTGELSAHGKRVVVIGGGDTGTDCVATSLRQGAVSVTQLEVLPRPPDERSPQNPVAGMAQGVARGLRARRGCGQIWGRPAQVLRAHHFLRR